MHSNELTKYDGSAELFWAKVNRKGPVHPILGSPCWIWCGWVMNGYGYARVCVGPRKYKSHRVNRVSWVLTRGPIPAGSQVLHRCNIALCVNPEHLYMGNNLDNQRDARLHHAERVARGETAKKTKGKAWFSSEGVEILRPDISKYRTRKLTRKTDDKTSRAVGLASDV